MVDLWKKRAHYLIKKGTDRTEAMLTLFEKCVLFRAVAKSSKPLVDVDLVVADVADFLVGEDLRDLALKYLETIGNAKQSNVAFAKERVFNSDSTHMLAKQFVRPQFPYQVEKIRVQMSQFVH